ncbi:MAG: radical SAM protein, partial [Candidatus Zixiibacteriota bacterium]
LLGALEEVDGVEWIRLLYLHPAGVSDRLINYVSASPKTLDYYDVPLQHINNELLTAMNRRVDRNRIETLIRRIRSASDGAVIRTTLIVGLPGETQSRFEELRDFVAEQEFDRLGVFCYSAEEGTTAADMPDRVPQEIAVERMDELMTLQQQIAFERNNALIGQTRDVIIDAVDRDGCAVGRTYADCPDVDQEVFIAGSDLRPGTICPVMITATRGYDLEGTLLGIEV